MGTTREDPIYFDSVDVKSTRMLQGEGRRNAKYINFFTWTQLEEPILLPFSFFTMEITNFEMVKFFTIKLLYQFFFLLQEEERTEKNREGKNREMWK